MRQRERELFIYMSKVTNKVATIYVRVRGKIVRKYSRDFGRGKYANLSPSLQRKKAKRWAEAECVEGNAYRGIYAGAVNNLDPDEET